MPVEQARISSQTAKLLDAAFEQMQKVVELCQVAYDDGEFYGSVELIVSYEAGKPRHFKTGFSQSQRIIK